MNLRQKELQYVLLNKILEFSKDDDDDDDELEFKDASTLLGH